MATGSFARFVGLRSLPLPKPRSEPIDYGQIKPVPQPIFDPLPRPVEPPEAEAGAIPIMRHLSLQTHDSETGMSIRSLPSVTGEEGTVTVTADTNRGDVWIGFEGTNGAVHFIQRGTTDTEYGSMAAAGWVVGSEGWGGWLILEAQDQATSGAYAGGRIVLRGADPGTDYEDWHVQASGDDLEFFHQTTDGDSATLIVAMESDTGDVRFPQGVIALAEVTTPTAVDSWGRIYTKSDNKLYFQDGAGTEHEIAFV